MTGGKRVSGIGAATTLHAVATLLLILIGLKVARAMPVEAGMRTVLILALPAVLAAVLAEATRRNGWPAVWQWALSFPPFYAAMIYVVASLPQLLGK